MRQLFTLCMIILFALPLEAHAGGFPALFTSAKKYTITSSAGANGTITASAKVKKGQSQRFVFTPSTHYHLASLLIDGAANTDSTTSYTFASVKQSHTIAATFAIDQFAITSTAGTGGALVPATASYDYGATQAFTFAPSSGYVLDSAHVDGVKIDTITTIYTFATIAANHTIQSYFGYHDTAAASFVGDSRLLRIPSNASLARGDVDYTWAFWVKSTTLGLQRVFAKDSNNTRDYSFYLSNASGYHFAYDLQTHDRTVLSNTVTAADTWYFVVCGHNSVANTVFIQVNNGGTNTASDDQASNASASAFVIGGRTYASSVQPFIGAIDNLALWGRVLTADEVTTLYNSGAGLDYTLWSAALKVGLVSYWPLKEAAGSTRADLVGTNTLTETGGTIANTTGKVLSP